MGLKQQKDANFNTSMQSSHQNPDPKSQQKKKAKRTYSLQEYQGHRQQLWQRSPEPFFEGEIAAKGLWGREGGMQEAVSDRWCGGVFIVWFFDGC
jgi:hypothetical protein